MKNHYKFISAAFLFFAGISISVQAQQIINKTFDHINELNIEGGSIEVSYEGIDNQKEIKLTASLGANEQADKDLIFVTIGNTLKISYQSNSNNWNNNNSNKTKRYIRITGPSEIVLKASNSSGILKVKNIHSAQTILKASSGIIEVENINGNLHLSASSGQIKAKDIQGDVKANISSGQLEIDKVNGNLELKSTSGMAKAKNISSQLQASLTSGSVSVENIGSLGNIELSSGHFKAKNAGLGANSSFRGSSGAIVIHTSSDLNAYNYELSVGSGMVRVGNQSNSEGILINNQAASTISGKIGSGMISITQ
ncbi:hypothetical protein GCM10007049_31470 [Echinicola pacifica]|uniref:DUF4097 domain-containing protein n=1 Tax=Echinicola pacifica TaxID=346377 RepID=A0A918UUY1_9BACT|nr:DUF4097 family beta strand repeat-containing protein [Echinicola pacifica]GGZ35898.1 hypothetical protein GCM10007049_31470 [Echinicola pacifica]